LQAIADVARVKVQEYIGVCRFGANGEVAVNHGDVVGGKAHDCLARLAVGVNPVQAARFWLFKRVQQVGVGEVVQFAAPIARHDGKGEYQRIPHVGGALTVAHMLGQGHDGFNVGIVWQVYPAGDV